MHSPEWYEKREVDRFLERAGSNICYIIKPTTGGYGRSGHPDRVVSLAGAFWGVELKRPGANLSPVQKRRIEEIHQAGGKAVGGTAEECIQVLTDWLNARGIVVR